MYRQGEYTRIARGMCPGLQGITPILSTVTFFSGCGSFPACFFGLFQDIFDTPGSVDTVTLHRNLIFKTSTSRVVY